jgi:class 3 adenylate cyclase
MDAVDSERAALLAIDGAFPIAALFAATYPTRTTSLIALGGYARSRRSADYPDGLPADRLKESVDLLANLWGTGETQHVLNPDLPWNEEIRSAWARSERAAASPAVFRRMMPLTFDLDVTDILPSIRVPTLIIQHADNPFLGGAGRYLGDHIPDAKYVALPGQNLYPVGSNAVAEISEFLTGERHEAVVDDDRVLATVLFTDIVDSTKRAAELGDHTWRQLLDTHDMIVRTQLNKYRGREVKTTGDGFLATFDGPARAIRCAIAIHDTVRALGIEVRAGVHTGEVEIRGEDVGGIAVHIGARVAAQADAGGILVSSTVKDLVVGSGLTFEDRGAYELKGVPGTWNLFAVAS